MDNTQRMANTDNGQYTENAVTAIGQYRPPMPLKRDLRGEACRRRVGWGWGFASVRPAYAQLGMWPSDCHRTVMHIRSGGCIKRKSDCTVRSQI